MNELESMRARFFDKILDDGIAYQWHEPTPECVGYMYTVGRTMRGEPELLIAGRDEQDSRELLADVVDQGTVPTYFRVNQCATGRLLAAVAVFGSRVTAHQLVWRESAEWPMESTREQPLFKPTLATSDPYPDPDHGEEME